MEYSEPAGVIEYADCISADGLYPSNECLCYDTKSSYIESPVAELWVMWRTTSLSLLPGPL